MDIKAKTRKTWTFSFEKWKEILNPILRGKYNYFLIPHKVMMELRPLFKARGRYMHGIPVIRFNELDGAAVWYDRVKLETKAFVDEDTNAAVYNGYARWSAGFNNWRGMLMGGVTGGTSLT